MTPDTTPVDLKQELELVIKWYIEKSDPETPDYAVDGFIISCLENAVSQVRTKELSASELRKPENKDA